MKRRERCASLHKMLESSSKKRRKDYTKSLQGSNLVCKFRDEKNGVEVELHGLLWLCIFWVLVIGGIFWVRRIILCEAKRNAEHVIKLRQEQHLQPPPKYPQICLLEHGEI